MSEENNSKLTKKSWLWAVLAVVLILIIAAIFFRFFSGKDSWVCSENQWVRQGNPSSPVPATGCGIAQDTEYQGTISAISNDQLKIKLESGEETDFKISGEIGIINSAGQPVSFSDLREGFMVLVKGPLGADNIITATNIRIILDPNIIVSLPLPGDSIGNPVTIKGEARVFENTFNYRVKDSAGNILAEKTAMASAPDAGQYGDFEITIRYSVPKTDNGVIEVFDYSAKDGSVIDLVSIPVVFKKVETAKIKVYFGNSKKDPNASDCNQVFAAEREIPKTEAIGRAAIEELLAGPTAAEKEEGYFTSLNSGAILQKLTIENGEAKADFDDTLQAGVGGSCKVAAIRAQIAGTLKQFSTVKSVIISINGRTEDILQP
ncbi:MAG: Gmad2 immunoglobulin-like domain-containing protein [Patescibacteria group bacterium]|jgi:hypothetical protein